MLLTLKMITGNIEISTVIGCKMGCDYCPQRLHVKEYLKRSRETVMSLETFGDCLYQIPSHVEVLFAGMAEPWLNPDCTEMVLRARNTGHRVGVYTTCERMTLADVELIKNIDFLHFCLHLPDADGIMKFNVTSEYLEVLKACLRIPKRNFMCIGKVHPLVEAITGPVPDSSNTLISRAGNLKTLAITPKEGALKCSAMSEKMDHNILLPNGDIILCCMDYSQKHVIGNLLKMTYEDLFRSEEYLKIKEGLLKESNILCRTCELAISN